MENPSKLILCLLIILIYGCQQRSDTGKVSEKSVPISLIQTDSSVKKTAADDSPGMIARADESNTKDSSKINPLPMFISGKRFQDLSLPSIDLKADSSTEARVSLSVLGASMIASEIKDTLRVRMYNYTSDTLTTGLHYTVEFQDQGKWNKVSPPENVGFEDLGYGILPFTARDFLVALFPDRHNYRSGKYRVLKRYHLRDYSRSKRKYEIFVEFEIE
ncbi:hypothetical protein FAZ15_10165 [Sphingobacterium olei]|uniref:Bacterial Ig-like domain-containing protein n=1 Tax=Sphingobacterium olei TaxID=2571155 RepID=A0A4U0P2V3_9SPHI|nr:immunoglobulin-like domain-containing protein [Sphingobacterium olei]TJZ61543.1 hypothetical protein FAZ15_10165 [Sphingobacterium olei]